MLIALGEPFRRIHLDSCESTQDLALEYVRNADLVGIVSTFHQTRGRGRGDRSWLTPPSQALTFSTIQWPYADFHAMPLLGMAWAVAVANVCDAQLQWPNDVVLDGKKVAGILTEVVRDAGGRKIAVVGIGINLTQTEFPPEIAHRATSLLLAGRPRTTPEMFLADLLAEIARIPEPNNWDAISEPWLARDVTPGKRIFVAGKGEAIAMGIDKLGNLIAQSETNDSATFTTAIGEVVYESSN